MQFSASIAFLNPGLFTLRLRSRHSLPHIGLLVRAQKQPRGRTGVSTSTILISLLCELSAQRINIPAQPLVLAANCDTALTCQSNMTSIKCAGRANP